VQPTVPDTETTRGDGEQGDVLGESVENTVDPGGARLPSTGANGPGTVAVLGGALVAAGVLVLAARRRLPATD
jgi:LPXTG-motif cell wall-anchored protein